MRAHPGGGRCCPEQEEGESAAGGSGAGGDSAIEQGGQGSALAPSPVSGVRREGARGGGPGRRRLWPWPGPWPWPGTGGPGRAAAVPSGGGGLGGDGGGCGGSSGAGGAPRREPVPFPSGSAGLGPRGPRATESGKRMDCPALPPGWKKEEVIRKSGLSAGKSDVYYFSPSGKKFRSKPQLARYLGNTVDLSSFDFRTGKMMPSKLQKNKQRLRNDPLNQNKLHWTAHHPAPWHALSRFCLLICCFLCLECASPLPLHLANSSSSKAQLHCLHLWEACPACSRQNQFLLP
uniref:Methyl-CpG binding domain protein 2 n=1 Tax=Microcebus murinus TaxID=30608 RepID=A0A8C5W7H8_MICMU